MIDRALLRWAAFRARFSVDFVRYQERIRRLDFRFVMGCPHPFSPALP